MAEEELEADFYRTRIRQMRHLAAAGNSDGILDADRFARISKVCDECLARKRSNGPAADEFERLTGDLASREFDITALRMEVRQKKAECATWQVAAREARADLARLQSAIGGGRWSRLGYKLGAWVDNRSGAQ